MFISASTGNIVLHSANVAIVLTLALSLVVGFGGVGLVLAALLLHVLATRLQVIPQSVRNFDRSFRISDSGITYLTAMIYALTAILVSTFHVDDMGEVETSIKIVVICYFIFNYIDGYNLRLIFIGSAVGAVLACGIALYEVGVIGVERADGPTNAIRFGMIAVLFSGLSLAALLFSHGPRWFSTLMTLGAFGGLLAGFLSGSRGAILAVPALFLVLLPRVWKYPRAATISLLFIYGASAASLAVLDVGSLKLRAVAALDQLQFQPDTEGVTSDSVQPDAPVPEIPLEESVSARVQLLRLSFDLFRQNPLFGGGESGWDAEISRRMLPNETGVVLSTSFNQAHNQYANDFAKGGLARGFAGIALLGIPMFLFFRAKPFSNREGSLAALAGLMTCLAFSVFCLTESVMSLSLPVSVYAVLVCYLMVAKSAPQA